MNEFYLLRNDFFPRENSFRGVCPSVRPSVTFVDSVEMNKHIFEIFSPSASHINLVFHTKRHGNIPTGTPL